MSYSQHSLCFYTGKGAVLSTLVLGMRASGDFSSGDVPFYALPSLDMRGFASTRYRDNNAVSAEAELRWQFLPSWGAVVFGGMGKVFEDPGGFGSAKSVPAGGMGIRWLAAKKEGINLSIDVATGAGTGTVWYFRIGEAF